MAASCQAAFRMHSDRWARALGACLGLAVGDSLGSTSELVQVNAFAQILLSCSRVHAWVCPSTRAAHKACAHHITHSRQVELGPCWLLLLLLAMDGCGPPFRCVITLTGTCSTGTVSFWALHSSDPLPCHRLGVGCSSAPLVHPQTTHNWRWLCCAPFEQRTALRCQESTHLSSWSAVSGGWRHSPLM